MGDSLGSGRRVIADVDQRGRVSLAKFGFRSMQVVIDTTDDGGLTIHPAIAMTVAEAAHYGDPEAVRLLEQALASAREGRLQPLPLRSKGRARDPGRSRIPTRPGRSPC
ncbi:MAG: hypothetical protein JW785_07495 [Acidimicrobiia bacterium]|nr:hypothetical protein [Acidimicrobiia bacterium]